MTPEQIFALVMMIALVIVATLMPILHKRNKHFLKDLFRNKETPITELPNMSFTFSSQTSDCVISTKSFSVTGYNVEDLPILMSQTIELAMPIDKAKK